MLGKDGKPYRCGGVTIRRVSISQTPRRVDRGPDRPWSAPGPRANIMSLFERLKEMGRKKRRSGRRNPKKFRELMDPRSFVWNSSGLRRKCD